MVQVGIEALGTVGTTFIKQSTKKKAETRGKASRIAEFEAEFGKVAGLGTDFNDSLMELVPNRDARTAP